MAPMFRMLATNTTHRKADGEFLRLRGPLGILVQRLL
jgi:hypothetical protein